MKSSLLAKMYLKTKRMESCSQIFEHGKRSVYLILSGLSLTFLQVTAQISPQYSLTVEISGIKGNKGVVMLQLLNSSQEAVAQEKGIIENDTCVVVFTNLAPSKYAIQYYHDENLNGDLDKNNLGIPVEGYGFSNNAYSMFGPKPFKDWLFDVNSDTKVELRIKN